MRAVAIVVLGIMLISVAVAEERPVQLKRAPGLETVEANCAACHSLDYIQMNSPFLDSAGWDAEVKKMINAFGAPIEQADALAITDYLTRNYGPPDSVGAGRRPAR